MRLGAFGATAFSTYVAFWMGVAATVFLVLWGKLAAADVTSTLAWILTAFAIFNTYMLLISAAAIIANSKRPMLPVGGVLWP